MEALSANFRSRFFADLLAKLFCLLLCTLFEAKFDGLREFLGSKIFVANRLRPCFGTCDHRTPKWLVAKEWYNKSGLACFNTCCCGACTAMVNNTRHVLEQPVMRHVAQHKYAIWNADIVRAEATPSL